MWAQDQVRISIMGTHDQESISTLGHMTKWE